jgi:hypothetical protein
MPMSCRGIRSFKRRRLAVGLTALGVLAAGPAAAAPEVSLGAGLRSSFASTSVDGADQDVNDFDLNSARLYVNGSVNELIKFTLNTEYNGEEVVVIDAIGRFEFAPTFNIWAGRFLPPSDRANLHGPYYGNAWGFAVDGSQDGFPFFEAGRDNGVAYWGDFDRVKVSAGIFDVPSTSAASGEGEDLVYAARLHLSLWDIEKGYYLNGTYYGDMDILSFGVAAQNVDSDTSVTFDALMEKKVAGGGAITVEGELASYEGKAGGYGIPDPFESSDGFFVLGAYLFPQQVGIGRFQLLGKYAANTYETAGADIDRDTVEANVNYIIKAFNARLSLFYIDTSFDGGSAADFTQVGLGLQLQI